MDKLEEGEILGEDSLTYLDEKVQVVLGNFQKEFQGKGSGPRFGQYGTFLPVYLRYPSIWSHPTPPDRNCSTPRSQDNLPSKGTSRNLTIGVPSSIAEKITDKRTPTKNVDESRNLITGVPSSRQSQDLIMNVSSKNLTTGVSSCLSEKITDKSTPAKHLDESWNLTTGMPSSWQSQDLIMDVSTKNLTTGVSSSLAEKITDKRMRAKNADESQNLTKGVPSSLTKKFADKTTQAKNADESPTSIEKVADKKIQAKNADESPTSILREMTLSAVPGGVLISPLHEELLCLVEKNEHNKSSEPLFEEKKDLKGIQSNGQPAFVSTKERSMKAAPKGEKLTRYDISRCTNKNPKQNSGSEIVPTELDNWVCCDSCEKWWPLPFDKKIEGLPEKWFCSMANWMPGVTRCGVTKKDTNRSSLRETSADAQHLDRKDQNPTSDPISIPRKNSKKEPFQESVRSRSLNEMTQPPTKSSLTKKSVCQDLSKSGNLVVEKYVPKERTLRSEREADQADGRNISHGRKCDEKDRSLIPSKKLVSSDGSLRTCDKKDISEKKRKSRDWQSNQNHVPDSSYGNLRTCDKKDISKKKRISRDSQDNQNHVETFQYCGRDGKIYTKEESGESELRKGNKFRTSKTEGKESCSNGVSNKKCRVTQICSTDHHQLSSMGSVSTSPEMNSATDALKKANEHKDYADCLKSSSFGSESTEAYFQAALMFLHGASLLETVDSESSKMTQIEAYNITANLCASCAQEYEKCQDKGGAALAYKCLEVAYLRIVNCKSSSISRDVHELQATLQLVPQGESPSSPASDVDHVNNQAAADNASLSRRAGHNHSNIVRLLDFTSDVNSAMEASRKSRNALAACNVSSEKGKNKDCITSLRRIIDFSFQDIRQLIRLIKLMRVRCEQP